ncbi:hypothetical protein E2C01_025682 [Portunus trituberculatus]|uniref:Uncharacterized protein n=1 Tax=Portunus trituberculatus TaxID=210409 RepID=A0A5B7EDX6_PORTR|nr:hypothetical protein [Portunus trituberculatus]
MGAHNLSTYTYFHATTPCASCRSAPSYQRAIRRSSLLAVVMGLVAVIAFRNPLQRCRSEVIREPGPRREWLRSSPQRPKGNL